MRNDSGGTTMPKFYFFIFCFIIALSTLPVQEVHSQGATYQSCIKRFQGQFSGAELERGCICSEKTLHKLMQQNAPKEQIKSAMVNCFTAPVSSVTKDTFYQQCIKEPKYAHVTSYRDYCACSADVFVGQMLKDGLNGANKASKDAASKFAMDTCLPRYMIRSK